MKTLVVEVEKEIARLRQARALLAEGFVSVPKKRGRPRKIAVISPAPKSSGRKLSAEGRKRISEAMKRRWASRKATTAAGA